MKHIRLFEQYSIFATLSNVEIVSIIAYFGKRLKNFKDKENHPHYKGAVDGLLELKSELKQRIKRAHTSEKDEIGRIANDVIRDILREEGRLDYSVGMFKTILKTIDATLENNELTIVVEDDNDYILYDEEKEYLLDLFNKYKKQENNEI